MAQVPSRMKSCPRARWNVYSKVRKTERRWRWWWRRRRKSRLNTIINKRDYGIICYSSDVGLIWNTHRCRRIMCLHNEWWIYLRALLITVLEVDLGVLKGTHFFRTFCRDFTFVWSTFKHSVCHLLVIHWDFNFLYLVLYMISPLSLFQVETRYKVIWSPLWVNSK